MFKTAEHRSVITLSNEGVSKANELFCNKIIMNEKEDKLNIPWHVKVFVFEA